MTYTRNYSRSLSRKRRDKTHQYNGFTFRGHNTKRGRGQTIDTARLVKKATIVTQDVLYIPTHSFNDFNISNSLLENITKRGYESPTPIQDKTIPLILSGKDVVGIANTGTGKTAAFLIPLISKVLLDRAQRVLIVAPTRELAVQIQEECDVLTDGLAIHSLLCIGGVSKAPQTYGLRKNPNFLIGTPGRLKDLRDLGYLSFTLYKNIVLDEVDRMLDMGFIRDVKYIINQLPLKRQSLFFSATLTKETEEIMHAFLKDPITVSVKAQETAQNVDQDVIKINGRQKLDVLDDLLRQKDFEKVLIFGRTKWGIEKLARQLEQRGVKVVSLHGNKNQNQRQRALEQFKNNQITVLLATDIASRGLDISDVSHVINYDLPETYEDYVHRIGRTGRANKKGKALSFID